MTTLKMLPPPSNKRLYRSTDVKLPGRIVSSLIAVGVSVLVFHNALFKYFYILNIKFLGEVLIGLAFGLLGFFILPVIFVVITLWLEKQITRIIANIVSNFWAQQNKRIQEARREKQKRKSADIERKNSEEFMNAVLTDTSVFVDGRIEAIVKTGFFEKNLIVPQIVLDELHLLADSSDKLKRQRGRRGLDVVKKLKTVTKVVLIADGVKGVAVDGQLLDIAKKYNFKLMTMDFNLNKLAQAKDIKVLNLNELANSIKTVLLPGETITIEILQEGKEKEQGVGYLSDGTMVVVENTKRMVGSTVVATVLKVIQSPAGKMIFCKL